MAKNNEMKCDLLALLIHGIDLRMKEIHHHNQNMVDEKFKNRAAKMRAKLLRKLKRRLNRKSMLPSSRAQFASLIEG